MKRYVLGFVFAENDPGEPYVLLIEKNRPEWHRGKLNGIGGKIEQDESPMDAMKREWLEETGTPPQSDFLPVCILSASEWEVYVFTGDMDMFLMDDLNGKKTPEGPLEEVNISELFDMEHRIILNLIWLIPKAYLALTRHDTFIAERCDEFIVSQKAKGRKEGE